MSGPNLFDDGKAPDAMRTIGEVSAAFGIKSHVLRYWEQQFPSLAPLKRSGGRRLYRPEDIATIARIDDLVNRQGYTLKGARQALKDGKAADAPADVTATNDTAKKKSDPDSRQIAGQLRAIRRKLDAALSD